MQSSSSSEITGKQEIRRLLLQEEHTKEGCYIMRETDLVVIIHYYFSLLINLQKFFNYSTY